MANNDLINRKHCKETALRMCQDLRMGTGMDKATALLIQNEIRGLKDVIEKLQAENAKLQKQIVGYGELLGSANHDVKQLTKYADDLEAENKRYAEALRKVENARTVTGPTDERLEVILELKKIAEQALRGKE